MPASQTTEVSNVHPAKVLYTVLPDIVDMVVTLSGIVILVKLLQFLNADKPIDVTLLGM